MLQVGSVRADAWKHVPQGLKPSLAQALCGTGEAVRFVRGPSFSAEVVPYVLHFSTPTWFRNRGLQHQLDQ